MATMTERLAFLISANADQAIRAFEKTGNAAEKELGRAEDKLSKLGGQLTVFGAGGMAFAGVAARGLFEFAQASEDAEAQSRKLANSIENAGNYADGAEKRLKDLADSIEGVTAADGDAIVGMQSLLVQFGLTENQVRDLTPLVVDLSRKMGIDMETAGKAVAKAAEGSEGALRKMGIQVDSTKASVDPFQATMDALKGTVGGFAEKEADTFAGKVEAMRVQLGNLAEGAGKGVVDVFGGILEGVTKISSGLADVDPVIQETAGQLMGFATAGIGVAGAISFVAGQSIKMKDRFVDADGALNKFGKTAKTASIALAGVAAVQIGLSVAKDITNAGENLEAGVDRALISLGKYKEGTIDATQAMIDFSNLAQKARSADWNPGIFWRTVGDEVRLAGSNINQDIEYIDQAFNKVLETSPELAQSLVDSLRKATGELDKNTNQYKENVELADRYQQKINETVGATEAVSQATGIATEELADLNDETETAIELTNGWKETLDAFDREAKLEDIATGMQEVYESGVEAFGNPTQENVAKYKELVRELYGDVGDYIEQLGNVPPEKQTEILAAMDANDFFAVYALLDELSKDREVLIKPSMPVPAGFIGPTLPNQIRLPRTGMTPDQIERFLAQVKPRAIGGSVSAGEPYLVGERGAELIVPTSNGTVIPNNRLMTAGRSDTPQVIVNVSGSVVTERELVESIRIGLIRAQKSGKTVVL